MDASSAVDSIPLGKDVGQEVLNISRETFRKAQPSSTGSLYEKILVGAAVIRYDIEPGTGSQKNPKVLLLKRVAAQPDFPEYFEIPSGTVDFEDCTIKHALVRAVKEKSGLDVTEIRYELNPMTYTSEENMTSATGRHFLLQKKAIQLNYVVAVSDGDVKFNMREHSVYKWASEEEVDALNAETEMKDIVLEAHAHIFTLHTIDRR